MRIVRHITFIIKIEKRKMADTVVEQQSNDDERQR